MKMSNYFSGSMLIDEDPRMKKKKALEADDPGGGLGVPTLQETGVNPPSGGENDPQPDASGGPGADMSAGGDDPMAGMDDGGMGGDDGFGGMSDDGGGMGDMGSEPELTPEQEDEVSMKKDLRENMLAFHAIVSNNIESLELLISEPRETEDDDLKTLYHISENLRNVERILYTELSENFNTKSYAHEMRVYIILKKVYDLNIVMLDKHYSNIKLQAEQRKAKQKKEEKANQAKSEADPV